MTDIDTEIDGGLRHTTEEVTCGFCDHRYEAEVVLEYGRMEIVSPTECPECGAPE
jgi:hypothetical protein